MRSAAFACVGRFLTPDGVDEFLGGGGMAAAQQQCCEQGFLLGRAHPDRLVATPGTDWTEHSEAKPLLLVLRSDSRMVPDAHWRAPLIRTPPFPVR